MIKTIIRYTTPFIASINDVIYGVLLYMEHIEKHEIDNKIYETLDLLGGSSILLIAYLIVTSRHMCKFYKTACWIILFMHVFSIIYIYTPITVIEYIYAFTVLSMFACVSSTIAVLGRRTTRVIRQQYRRLRKV